MKPTIRATVARVRAHTFILSIIINSPSERNYYCTLCVGKKVGTHRKHFSYFCIFRPGEISFRIVFKMVARGRGVSTHSYAHAHVQHGSFGVLRLTRFDFFLSSAIQFGFSSIVLFFFYSVLFDTNAYGNQLVCAAVWMFISYTRHFGPGVCVQFFAVHFISRMLFVVSKTKNIKYRQAMKRSSIL